MCGEKLAPPFWNAKIGGSPPHVRGKAAQKNLNLDLYGITPACAGKSLSEHTSKSGTKDHPRMCGEKSVRFVKVFCKKGSPPHVRGKGANFTLYGCPERITPACAGKSVSTLKVSPGNTDHPRMCGEKHVDRIATAPQIGSPPHVRGKGKCALHEKP